MICFIEGGYPGSNPKDIEFFRRAKSLNLKHAKLTAFGSTRFAKNPVEEDRNVRELVQAGTPVVAISFSFEVFGGSIGVAAGEKIARAFERATDRRAAVVALTASGGG